MAIRSLGSSSSSKSDWLHTSTGAPLTHALRFADQAASLQVPADALYNALLADAEDQPPNWNLQGRQINAWKQFGYIPQDLVEAGGANTKQVSRALEVR